MEKNLFEVATRRKYRFPYRGLVAVEDLWDLRTAELDAIFKTLNAEAKKVSEESLLELKTKEDEELSDKIISVTVRGYAPKTDSYQEITFTDPEEIKALGDMTRNERMLYYDPMYEEEDLTVEVTVADKTEKAEEEDSVENTYNSFFRKGEIPQIVKDRMGY